MLNKILNFYRLTKSRALKSGEKEPLEVPVSFVHIYHKEYPRLPKVNLPAKRDKVLEGILSKRKSTRKFSSAPLNLEQLSLILSSARILKREDEFERRTYPSAGARFPVEIYPVSFNVAGLSKGAYHYNISNENLELLLGKDLTNIAPQIVSGFIKNPSAAIILTSVMSRSEIKYQHKAYPFSLIEAGHIGQNISLICARNNIGCCAIGGYIDTVINNILDLTKDEIPIYAFAFGNISNNDKDKAANGK